MDKNEEQPKKCFCARCFLPIDAEEKIDIEGQNFHLRCSMCCICRRIPQSLKMFYGHVFCNDCFKTHVLSRFRETPRFQCNNWCMQWGPNVYAQGQEGKNDEKAGESSEETCKRCICTRCLQAVDEKDKVEIGGQSFHTQCAKCYFCQEVPKSNVKIYYGQVFCDECFNRHILNRNKDNSCEFFKNCFEQWQSNAQFSESMKEFMNNNANGTNVPFVFMMDGTQPSCRCGSGPQEWFQNKNSEPRKCV